MRSYYYNSNMTVLVVKYSLPVVKYSLLVAQKHVLTTSTVLRFYYQYSNIYAQYIMTVEDVLQRVYMFLLRVQYNIFTTTVQRLYYQYSNMLMRNYLMTVEDVLQRVYMLGAGIVLAVLALSYTTPWDNYLVYKVRAFYLSKRTHSIIREHIL
jgi:hypothetical protein